MIQVVEVDERINLYGIFLSNSFSTTKGLELWADGFSSLSSVFEVECLSGDANVILIQNLIETLSTIINLLPLCSEESPGMEEADHRWAGCLVTGKRGESQGAETRSGATGGRGARGRP